MPTKLETAAELNKALKEGVALWTSPIPIADENVPFEEVEGQDYLSTYFIPYQSSNTCVGAANTQRIRTVGVLQIVIRASLEKGIGKAYTYSNDIESIMSNQMLLPDLFTESASTRRVGDTNDGWFSLICDVPFISDKT